MSGPRWTVLVADDDPLFCRLVEERLKDEGVYDVVTALDAAQARNALRKHPVDVAVLDLQLNGDEPNDMSGLAIAVNEAREIPCVLITNHREREIEQFTAVLDRYRVPHSALPQILYKHAIDEDRSLKGLRKEIHDLLVPRVFVVHGHDATTREAVENTLKRLRLAPTVLDAGPGEIILQRFRAEAARAHYAVVLVTGDDRGASRRDVDGVSAGTDRQRHAALTGVLKPRARQNVIFELGYFAALLGPDRVLVLYEEGVERPSDYEGVGYVPLDAGGIWKEKMEDALRKAGVERTGYAGAPPPPPAGPRSAT